MSPHGTSCRPGKSAMPTGIVLEAVVDVIISASHVSLNPRARIIMYSGLTVAMGGNMETERTKPSISVLYLIFSFARPKPAREPMIMDRMVVDAAIIALFMIILENGCPLKIET